MSQAIARSNNIPDVTKCCEIETKHLVTLFSHYGLSIRWIDDQQPIPGSHFGEPEAGLIADVLYLRNDTPVHSALHEACHYICMDRSRRNGLHTDAGGDYDEENAVCYLSILLANNIEEYDSTRMMQDMDTWGYTFRLGSAKQWFENDAEDALVWLLDHELITQTQQPTWTLRQ